MLKKKLIDLAAKRDEAVKAAEEALLVENQEEYEKNMKAVNAFNAEMKKIQDLLAEQVKEIGTKAEPEDKTKAAVENMDRMLRSGAKVELPRDAVLTAIREAMNSILIGTDSLAKPTGVGTTIRDNHDYVSELINRVTVLDLYGCSEWQEPYVKVGMTALAGTDGSAPTASDPTFRVAVIKPQLVDTMAYVSRHIANLTPAAYVNKVQELALKALKTKVVELMTKGDGSTFYGILTATNTKGEAIYDTMEVTSATIGADFLRKLVLSAGGSNTTGTGILMLKKADLIALGDIRGTNEKLPVFEIIPDVATNGNTGIIKDGGFSVSYILNDQLTALTGSVRGEAAIKTMVYVDLTAYVLGLFGNYTVEVDTSYKFAEGLWTIRGEVLAGGNLVADKAATVVTLKAADPVGGGGEGGGAEGGGVTG